MAQYLLMGELYKYKERIDQPIYSDLRLFCSQGPIKMAI